MDNPKLLWHFRLLQTQYTLDENDMKVIFDSVADTADDLLTNVTVLFVSQDNYDAFADAANRAISKIAMIEAGYDAMDTPVSYEFSASYSNLSYALVDRETWTVNDWSDINS